MKTCRILIVEDHALVREAMVSALEGVYEAVRFFQAACGQDALALIEAEKDFDLVLLDLMLPDISGFSLLSVLAHRFPTLPVIVVSALIDEASIKRALKAGASGFLSKTLTTQELVDAVRAVLRGDVVLSPVQALPIAGGGRRRGVDFLVSKYDLTAAQTRVMELMLEGRTNREIADMLGVAEGTVKVHCSAILRALRVSNRAQALAVLARQGVRT